MPTTPGHRDTRTDTRATQPHEHQRCINTLSGSGAGACANGLEDACTAKNERRRDTKPKSNVIREVDQDERTKVRFVVPPEVPNTDIDESDMDELRGVAQQSKDNEKKVKQSGAGTREPVMKQAALKEKSSAKCKRSRVRVTQNETSCREL